jgi:RNA polymerase sigma factor (sigma-70 family)
MPASPINEVIQHLRSTMLAEGADLTDGQLLECFVSRREPAALEALVRRHGPMVWGVCRRLLGNHHDAEDAFQAAFLVLVRKAASIRWRAKVGNWLYGVAHQTALKARAMRARRQQRERPAADMPEPTVREPDPWNELQPLLDQEVSRLPEKYRAVIVLCELGAHTVREAARHLGCPEGTVASRLARARAMLAKRLARHGPSVTGATLAAVLSQRAAASVPTSVLSSTIKAVTAVAAGQAGAPGVISVKAAALTEGVLKAMFMNKLMKVTAVLCVIALGVFGAGQLGYGTALETQGGGGAGKQETDLAIIKKRLADLNKQMLSLSKELKAVRAALEGRGVRPASKGNELRMVPLPKEAKAEEVAKILEQLFNTSGQPKAVHIAAYASKNLVVVRGRANDLDTVEATISRLLDQKPSPKKDQDKKE